MPKESVNGAGPEVEDAVVDLFEFEGDDPLAEPVEADDDSANAATDPATSGEPAAAAAAVTIPDKFQGKTKEEIIESYLHVESALGRRNNEYGDLRKQVDSILQKSLTPQAAADTAEDEFDSDTFLDDPKTAIKKVIANDPEVRAIKSELVTTKRERSLASFETKHGKIDNLGQIDGLGEWISASPKRLAAWQRADESFDYEAAGDMLDTYKEIQAARQAAVRTDESNANREEGRKAVSAPPAGGGSGATAPSGKGSGGKAPRKFKRRQLMRLMKEDPKRYAKMEKEILTAYAEKRVID